MKPIIVSLFLIILTSCSDQAKLQALHADASILAFGDSLTYGSGASREKAYPAILETIIKRSVINVGIPGEISAKGLLRLPHLLAEHQPDLLIICHGANDILRKLDIEQTQDNIQQMIDLAREKNIQVVLIGVPEFGLFFNSSPIYQSLADKNRIPIENDVLGDILANNAYKADHVHPNAQGYQLLAESIAALLKRSGALASD